MVDELQIQNFRKHRKYNIKFKPGINLIIGPNGSGKTSLIEAIYISLQGKSWKSNFDEILNKSSEWWRIDYQNRVVKYNNQKKHFIINNKTHTRLPEQFKKPVIIFEPQDLNLLYRSPSARRDWLDGFISGLEPDYRRILNKYQRVLKQRNSLLKNQASKEQLFVWDIQFSSLASLIIKTRKKYLKIINKEIEKEYSKITSQKTSVFLDYKYEIESEQTILNTINLNYQYEIISGHTSVGPHQHDIVFYVDQKDASKTLSRGENRSLVLALKNLEYSLKKKEHPLVLLDDILSEFDDKHQENLINNFKNEQVIITGVNKPKNIKNIAVFKLG